jgi:hypothetical protein
MCRGHWITYVRIVLYIPQLLQKCVVGTELHMSHFCNNCGIYNTIRTYVIQCPRHISVITVVYIIQNVHRHWITYVRIVLFIPQLLQKCVVDTELHMYVLYYIYHSYYRNVSWALNYICTFCIIYTTVITS